MAGGKKARGRATNKAKKKQGEAATPPPAPPPPPPPAAVPSSSDEPRQQQVPQPEEATAALACASDRVKLTNRLHAFAAKAGKGLRDDAKSWVASEFSGDFGAVAAAADRGDGRAQFALACISLIAPHICGAKEGSRWFDRALEQGYDNALLYSGLRCVESILKKVSRQAELIEAAVLKLKVPAEEGDNARAQHALGMRMYHSQCDSGSKADFLDAARWIRKAARASSPLPEAQYELSEMFRKGLFTETVELFLARKYLNQAAE
jgi:TPR repeat protein